MMLVLEPPAQFDHPFHGTVIEQRLPQWQLLQRCHGPAGGCSWLSKGVCYIALPRNEKDSQLIALIREHEIGHCNGWPAWHPNARRVEYGASKKTKFKVGRTTVTLY
jgi:hypothetical protein